MSEPTIPSVICPQCEKTWLAPLNGRTLFCYCCNYVMLAKQAKEHPTYAVHQSERENAAS